MKSGLKKCEDATGKQLKGGLQREVFPGKLDSFLVFWSLEIGFVMCYLLIQTQWILESPLDYLLLLLFFLHGMSIILVGVKFQIYFHYKAPPKERL